MDIIFVDAPVAPTTETTALSEINSAGSIMYIPDSIFFVDTGVLAPHQVHVIYNPVSGWMNGG